MLDSILSSTYVQITFALILFGFIFLRPAKPTATKITPTLKPNAFQSVNIKSEMEKDTPKTGKRYAVIGVGFVGRCIIEMLLERGDGDGKNGNSIVCIDMMKVNPFESNPNWCHAVSTEDRFLQPIENLSKRVEYVQADVTNVDSLISALDNKKIDVVFCTAALIAFSQRLACQAEMSYKVNVVGAQNVCNALIECGIPNLVFTSTSNVVLRNDSKDRQNLTEESPLATKETSYNHYSWSKADAEKIVLSMNGKQLKKNGGTLNVVAPRPCSGVFGFYDRLMTQRLVEDPNGQTIVQSSDKSWIQYIYVNNLVFGEFQVEKALLARNEGVVGKALNLCGEYICTEMIYRFMIKYWPDGNGEKRLPLTFLPPAIFKYMIAPVVEGLQWLTNNSITPKLGELAMMTKPMLDLIEVSYSLTDAKARNKDIVGFRDLFTFEQACQRVAWQYYTEEEMKKKKGGGKKCD